MRSLPTGRGYADYNTHLYAPDGNVHEVHGHVSRDRTGHVHPQPGARKAEADHALGANGAGGDTVAGAYDWGFPLTTMTVVARKTGTIAGNPHNTTFTAKG